MTSSFLSQTSPYPGSGYVPLPYMSIALITVYVRSLEGPSLIGEYIAEFSESFLDIKDVFARDCSAEKDDMKATTVLRKGAWGMNKGVDFTHAVIGGGAVGLAIARRLAEREGGNTVLVERNEAVGMESSSRNSEVIHAGIYYGKDSLKTKLCIEGRERMYQLCDKYNIPYKKCGKWIVAQTDQQREELTKVYELARSIGVPTEFVSPTDATRLEPDVQAKTGILASPTTGILDSHAYMQFLHGAILDAGGDVATNTTVTSIIPLSGSNTPGSSGWSITTSDNVTLESSTITASCLINSAGLGACAVNNMVLPAARHATQYYAKGNYFSYGAATPHTSRLIYPAPEPGLAGLGTHLTLDMQGRIRFGPDVEWVDSPHDLAVNAARLPDAVREIRKFLPGIDEERLAPDYAGIRAKLSKGGSVAGVGAAKGGMQDFVIRREDGFEGFVNLLGIESPGLTSSLAIAKMVEGLLYE